MTALVVGLITLLAIWGLLGRFGLGLVAGIVLGLVLAGTPAGPWLTGQLQPAVDVVRDGAPEPVKGWLS